MFGGLDVKGGGGGGGDKKKDNAVTGEAPPSTTAPSAFSFLQGFSSSPTAAATEAAPAAATSSGFSFLAAAGTAANTASSPSPAPAASAFGFMSTTTATSSTAEATPAVENGTGSSSSSGFNFLQPEATVKETVDNAAVPTSTAPSSAFNFMASGDGGSSVSVDASESGLSMSSSNLPAAVDLMSSLSSAAPLPPLASTSSLSSLASPPPPPPAGAGVVFGGAAAAKNTIKKKRNRTSRIGVGAHAPGASPPAAAVAAPSRPPLPEPSATAHHPPAQPPAAASVAAVPPTRASSTTPPVDTAAAALEAQERAERFMHGKLQEEYAEASSSSMRHPSSSLSAAATARMSSSSSPGLATIPSTDSDDIIAAAKAAAEEAQHISQQQQQHKQQQQQRSWGGGLGGLFRARSGAAGTGNNNSSSNLQASGSNNSAHGGSSIASASSSHNVTEKTNNRPPVPTSITSNSLEERPNETPVERLQREQEQVKRAMAERQRQMLHHAPAYAPEASSSEPLGIPSYGESRPIAVIPVPGPTSSLSNRSVSLPVVASPFSRPVGSMSAAAARTPAPPPPQKATTPTDLFHEMMKEFRAKVVLSMDEVKRLRKHRSVLLEERFGTKAKERLAAQQKAQAEAQQMAAAEAEDFELADRMGSLIESHARECAEHKAILENIGRALVQLDSQKKSLVQDVTKCFNEIQGKLKAFQEQEESKESHDNTEALKRFSAISKQLSAENERLQQDLKHLEKDADAVAVERKELEKAISEQAGVFEKLRDEARTRLVTVEEEIEDLRKQLAAKVAVAAELRTEAAGHDESVLKVRVKFSRQLNRVQQKEMTIRDNREEWEFEKKSFESQKEVHDKEVAEHSEALLTRDQLLGSLKREIELADSFESIVSKEIGFEVSQDDVKEIDEELAQLQAEVSKSEAAVSESKEILKTAVAAIAALEEEQKATEARIPQLEEEKKAAAARRDFKAAGKASKEVKDSTTRLKEIELDLTGHVQERKEAAEAELIQLEQDLKVKRQVANEKEKEAGIAAMHRLADNIKRLLVTKESVCAKEETSIQSVGSYVLDGQIEALRLEGQTYGDKYGGWLELMSEIGLDHTVRDEQKVEEATNDNCNDEPDIVKQSSASPVPAATTANGYITKQDSVEEVDPEVKKQAMASFCALMAEIGNTNVAIEAAAETEDFEKAAELDEELQRLLAAVENLGLTDDEMAAALAAKDESSSAPELPATATADSSEEDPPVQTEDEVAPAIDIQQGSTTDQETSDQQTNDIAPQQESSDGDDECKLDSSSNDCEPAVDQQTTMDDENGKLQSSSNDCEPTEDKQTKINDEDDAQIIEKEESEDFVQQGSADDEQDEVEPMNANLNGDDNGERVEDKPMMGEDAPPIENCASNDSADAAATISDDDL